MLSVFIGGLMKRFLIVCGLAAALLAPAWAGSSGETGVLAPGFAPGLAPLLHSDARQTEHGPVLALRHCGPRCH
ncbi:UNVERIFIED_ORG: hypothetical protein CLV66_12410 [Actinomadura viridilutea]